MKTFRKIYIGYLFIGSLFSSLILAGLAFKRNDVSLLPAAILFFCIFIFIGMIGKEVINDKGQSK